MIYRTIGKLCSAIACAILLSLVVQHQFEKRRQMSREDFLAQQAKRYDRDIEKPTPYAATVVVSFVMVGILLGGYELVGFVISKVAGGLGNRDEVPRGPV